MDPDTDLTDIVNGRNIRSLQGMRDGQERGEWSSEDYCLGYLLG